MHQGIWVGQVLIIHLPTCNLRAHTILISNWVLKSLYFQLIRTVYSFYLLIRDVFVWIGMTFPTLIRWNRMWAHFLESHSAFLHFGRWADSIFYWEKYKELQIVGIWEWILFSLALDKLKLSSVICERAQSIHLEWFHDWRIDTNEINLPMRNHLDLPLVLTHDMFI